MHILCAARSSTDVGVRAGVLPSKSAGLLQDLIQRERDDNQRILYQDEHTIACTVCAATLVWIAPQGQLPRLLTSPQSSAGDLPVKTVTLKYDGLWNRPFPYLWLGSRHLPTVISESHLQVLSAVPDP